MSNKIIRKTTYFHQFIYSEVLDLMVEAPNLLLALKTDLGRLFGSPNFFLFLVRQRFAWRIRDYSNLGSLLTEYMKEKVGSAHVNQTPDALGNWILKINFWFLGSKRVQATFESLLRG